MTPSLTLIFSSEQFKKSAEFLRKYFGITLSYFEHEFENLPSFQRYSMVSETPYLDTLEEELSISMNGYLSEDDIIELTQNITETDESDYTIICSLAMLLTVLVEQRHLEVAQEEFYNLEDEWTFNLIKEDLLKLYIYIKETPFDKQDITLKRGKKTIKLKNHSNWAFERMALGYLKRYLQDH